MDKYNKNLTRIAKGGTLSAIGDFFVVFSTSANGLSYNTSI